MDVLALPRSTRNLQENSDVEALCGREVDARGEADEDGLQNCGDWWFCFMELDRRYAVCERGE
jgi:hypothetical protein